LFAVTGLPQNQKLSKGFNVIFLVVCLAVSKGNIIFYEKIRQLAKNIDIYN